MSDVRQAEAARRFEPTEHYAAWRNECPLHHEADHAPPFYVLSRFDDIVAVLKQPDLWRNGDGPGVFHQDGGVLGTTDEPDHGRHRRVLRDAFVPSAIARLEPRLRAITDALLAPMLAAGGGDFVAGIAMPLPSLAIAELLGVRGADHAAFGRWSNDAVAALTGGKVDRYHYAKSQLEGIIAAGCDDRDEIVAAGHAPPDDVLTMLAAARRDGTLSPTETVHIGYQLLVAGHETTTNLLGMLLFRLLAEPELLNALRADPQLIPVAVEEGLRFDAPVHGLFRTNAEPCALHGTELATGTKVQLVFAAANRDPAQFGSPDEFRLDRERTELGRHLAFGWGIHHCIGAPLARLEARVALEQLLARTTEIRVVGDAVRNDSFVMHGLIELPVELVPVVDR